MKVSCQTEEEREDHEDDEMKISKKTWKWTSPHCQIGTRNLIFRKAIVKTAFHTGDASIRRRGWWWFDNFALFPMTFHNCFIALFNHTECLSDPTFPPGMDDIARHALFRVERILPPLFSCERIVYHYYNLSPPKLHSFKQWRYLLISW